MKALPTSSVPGVDEKLHGIPSIFVSKYRGAVEPSTVFMLLVSLKVLEAAFVTGLTSNVLRNTGGKRGDGSLIAAENGPGLSVQNDPSCSWSGRDQ